MSTDLGFVHRFVPGDPQKTVLVLHGTGGNETDLLGLAQQVAPQASLLSPRGKILENGAPRFFKRLAMNVFDEEDLRFRAAELSSFVNQAALRYGFDPLGVYALGYSNGANIAAAVLLLHPQTLAGAALWRPIMPLPVEPLPNLAAKPVLIAAGLNDPYSPLPRVQALHQALQQAGATVQLFQAAPGHGLAQADLEATARWFKELP